MNAPAMVAWKAPIERRIVEASGMRGVVIVSSVAYGDGGVEVGAGRVAWARGVDRRIGIAEGTGDRRAVEEVDVVLDQRLDLVSTAAQSVEDVRADEPGRSGKGNPHALAAGTGRLAIK